MDGADWKRLNATARRLLRVPITWMARRNNSPQPVRLAWVQTGIGMVALLVRGSPVHDEVLRVLASVGVRGTERVLSLQFRRLPMGAVMTDPVGSGLKDEVETVGCMVLAKNLKGQWQRLGPLGARWEAHPAFGEFVAMVQGFTAPTSTAPAPLTRYAVERRVRAPELRPGPWGQARAPDERLEGARSLATALAAQATPADGGHHQELRVLDTWTGAVRFIARWVKGKLVTKTLDPVVTSNRPTSTKETS